jgi:ribosomal protein S21
VAAVVRKVEEVSRSCEPSGGALATASESDHARRAALVLDNDIAAEALRELRRDRPRDHVVAPARRKWHHEAISERAGTRRTKRQTVRRAEKRTRVMKKPPRSFERIVELL